MDYGEVLTKAWKIIWKYKILWIFGILASCAQGGGGGGGGGGNTGYQVSSDGDLNELPPQMQEFFLNIERFFNSLDAIDIALYLFATIILVLLLVVIVQALSTIGKIGLIQGTVQGDAGIESLSFGDLFSSGKPYFWRIFWFNLLVGLVFTMVALLIILPLVGLTVVTFGIGLLCLIPVSIFLIPLSWVFNLVVKQGNVAIVVEDLNLVDGFQQGLQVVRQNLGTVIVMGLLLLVVGLVAGLVIAVPIILIVLPGVFALIGAIASESQTLFSGGLIVAVTCFVIYLPILIVLNGILTGYLESAWTLTYLRLSKPMPVENELLDADDLDESATDLDDPLDE